MVLRILGSILVLAPDGCGYAHEPSGGDIRKVGEVIRFPDFCPGPDIPHEQPQTQPEGPFHDDDRLILWDASPDQAPKGQ